jgi:hypothetical protein
MAILKINSDDLALMISSRVEKNLEDEIRLRLMGYADKVVREAAREIAKQISIKFVREFDYRNDQTILTLNIDGVKDLQPPA